MMNHHRDDLDAQDHLLGNQEGAGWGVMGEMRYRIMSTGLKKEGDKSRRRRDSADPSKGLHRHASDGHHIGTIYKQINL
jgi:hypothetical protein